MLKEDSSRCPGCMELLEGAGDCPYCGYSARSEYDLKYLRPGVTLGNGQYFAGKLEQKNGEGATYLGFDNKSGQRCWIREYFPTSLARRHPVTGEVSPVEGYDAQFKALISDFVDVCNEVKRLQVTERVIPVIDAFSDNNTLYAVYEYMNVISFDKYLSQKGGKLPLNKALDIFLPLCHMVGTIHDHGHIHRGISPYTLYVDKDENLYLWDFSLGAARTANSELEAQLFNGYSAPEQYSASGWQGPWTDVYALGALLYRMVSGFVPPKSTLVGESRPLTKLDDLVMNIPGNISNAVSEAMEQRTELRTQAVYLLTSSLTENGSSNTAVYGTVKNRIRDERREPEPERPVREKDGGFKYALLALVFTVVALFCGLLYVTKTYFPTMLDNEQQPPPTHSLSDSGDDSEQGMQDDASGGESDGEDDKIEVPRFVGQMFSVIESDSNYKGKFDFAVHEEYNTEFPEGVVFKQSPTPDSMVGPNSTVTLYVSRGAELVTMPNIIGLDYNEALRILGEKNLSCAKIERYASGAVAGSVVGTVPAPGADVDPAKHDITVYVMPAGSPPPQVQSTTEASSEAANEGAAPSGESSKSESSAKASSSSKESSKSE